MFGKTRKKKVDVKALNAEGRLSHIAFIMDGNGRWAKKRGMPRTYGHAAGAKVFRQIIEYCGSIGIRAVTVYAFSTENWKRPPEEVETILSLFNEYLADAEKSWREKNIQVHFLGSKSVFPPEIAARMERLEEESKDRDQILNIAVNYGGRDDIVHAVNELIAEGKTSVCEADITSHLYSKASPPPDLIVRTGAEQRLSNFLLWEAAYAEFYFTEVLWPDFDERSVDECVIDFYRRKRRFGGL